MTSRPYATHTLKWRGILLEVRYCPDWLDSYREIYGHPMAHIEIETLDPPRVPLPVTETGYRSHFTRPEAILEAGGPVAFVRAALDEAAEAPAWKEREAAAQQYDLF